MALDMTKLRNLNPDELDNEENELREGIWKLRLQMKTGQLQDPFKVLTARRDLARVMTVKRERQLAVEGAQQ